MSMCGFGLITDGPIVRMVTGIAFRKRPRLSFVKANLGFLEVLCMAHIGPFFKPLLEFVQGCRWSHISGPLSFQDIRV